MLRALSEQGYQTPTPIQAKAIPPILEGRDVLGAAQTGTGKTAAFTLPLLQQLALRPAAQGERRPIRALVLAPTRELAIQVEESVRTYGAHMPLRSLTIYGGVGMQPQIDGLRRGTDIVVATPGRLLDHLSQKTLSLDRIEHVILDEADRMLDMGFIHDVRRILSVLPKKRQTLLFSATFSPEIRALSSQFLRDPVSVEAAERNVTATGVTQVAHPVAAASKRDLLVHLIRTRNWPQVLVFTRTKHGANRLAEQLTKSGIQAEAIHGNKSQNARVRSLSRFKNLDIQVLVATDVAARGIDIASLPCVVNYDLPNVAEDYVHRIGRTARAGAAGEAVSLFSSEERGLLSAIEALTRQKIERSVIEGFAQTGTDSAATAPEPARRSQAPRGRSGAQSPRGGGRHPAGPGARTAQGSQGARAEAPRGEGARGEGGRGAGRSRSANGSRSADARRSGGGAPRAATPVPAQTSQRPVQSAESAGASRPAVGRSSPMAALLSVFGVRRTETAGGS